MKNAGSLATAILRQLRTHVVVIAASVLLAVAVMWWRWWAILLALLVVVCGVWKAGWRITIVKDETQTGD